MTREPAGRRATLLVLLAGAILFFPGLGNHDLWNPNEPVFAEGAREMLQRGEWLVPYVNDELYVDKPVLYFWAILAASLPAGDVSAWSARLPSAVASLLLLWAVMAYGRRAFGERAALFSALALASMPIFVWEARFAQMDPMLALFMFLCLVCFQRARAGASARWLAASGAWAGLAMLTKGPVGLVLPGAAALLALAIDRDLRFLRRPAWLAGGAAFLLVAAPWYAAVGLAGHGEWLRAFFLDHNVRRFTDPFDHAQPFYYFGGRFLTDLFPWSLFAVGAVSSRPRDEEPAAASAWRLLAIYAAVTLVFFSLSGAKRGVYILPMYPAYALLVGRFFDRAMARGASFRATAAPAALAGGLLLVAGIAAPVAAVRRYPEFVGAAAVLGGLLAVTGAATLLSLRSRDGGGRVPGRTFATLATGLAAAYLVAFLWVAPQVDPLKSARAFSQRILAHAGEEAPLRSFGFWRWRSEYLFYTGRRMPVLDSVEEVEAFLARPEPVFVIVEESDRDALAGASAPLHLLESSPVGGKTMFLYSNRPPT